MANRDNENCAENRDWRHQQHQDANVEVPKERTIIPQRCSTHDTLRECRLGEREHAQRGNRQEDKRTNGCLVFHLSQIYFGASDGAAAGGAA